MQLITWNIQWGRGADGRVDLQRIAADARRLAGNGGGDGDADVLCLQEVSCGYPELGGCDGSDQFAALAALWPRHTAIAGIAGIATDTPAPGGGRRGFGNMILSRYPVRQVLRHLLPWPADGISSMQRIALEATLDTPLGLLRVTTTHLEYYSATQRGAQVQRLRELQREGAAHARATRKGAAAAGPFESFARGGPSILCGDFNCLPGSKDHAALLAPFDDATPRYADAWALLHPGVPHAPSVGLYDKRQWPQPPFTFDFFFVSEDLAPRLRELVVDQDSAASDHQPVLLRLA